MGLWIVLALMTGAAVLLALAPLMRRAGAERSSPGGDAAVYRDQIDEIERDQARGLIGGREADAARAEIARRLFAATAAEDAAAGDDPKGSVRRRRAAAVATLVVVPAVSLGVYGALGRPDVADLPLAARISGPADQQNIQDLVTRVEAELARNPDDGRGWAVLGPVYMRLERPADAAEAFGAAIRLLGSTPAREADRGEALMAAAGGVVTTDARAAFERAARGDPPSPKGAIYLARAAAQDEDPAGALALLKPLVLGATDAPYAGALRGELVRLAAAPPLPAPAGAEAGAETSPEERMTLVRGMVDRLADRLAAEPPGDLGDWLRLVQSRAALDEAGKARAALATARERFGGDPRAAARLEALALGLGLEGPGA